MQLMVFRLLILLFTGVGGGAVTTAKVLLRPEASQFKISEGFFAVEVLGRQPHGHTCYDLARAIDEPYTERYLPKKELRFEYPWTQMKRSYYHWPGSINKTQFIGARPKDGTCPNCHTPFHYKIIGGRLYTLAACAGLCEASENVEELLKVTMHLYNIPDMEFLVQNGDGCAQGKPTINYSVCRGKRGFSMPSGGVWGRSLGPVQMASYHACLRERYPADKRVPKAVWRGSSTSPVAIRKDNYWKVPRVAIPLLTRNHSDILDARLTHFTNSVDEYVVNLVNTTLGLARFIPMEDYNKYCVIIDMDGNGWSDRFGNSLIHYPTPLLRLASNITDFFSQYYAPDHAIMHFDLDTDKFLKTVKKLVDDCKYKGANSRGQQIATNMRRITEQYMDQVGVVEAMAYTLLTYKNKTTWELDTSLAGFIEVNVTCCKGTRLPWEVASKIK